MHVCVTCAASEVTRVLLCSGKMGYDLAQARAAAEGPEVKTAVIRIEVG